ncbi:MAG TPA: hypothetical protein VF841_09165 [Anaeromyxobacter sp.]
MTGALLALALAASPALAQEEWQAPDEEQEEGGHRLSVAAWGGEALDESGTGGKSYGVLGGEVAWAFDQLDLGVAGYGYRHLSETRTWTPVALVRLVQRFRMRSGVEATFGLGIGAARPSGWEAWFQVGLGARVTFGPVFLGGELAFERSDLLRLTGGLGLTF